MSDIVEAIKCFFRGGIEQEVNVSIPGYVISYDKSTRTAKVRTAIAFGDEGCPEIEDVPVVFPCTSEVGLFFPLKEGDQVLLVLSHSSLEEWLSSGGNEGVTPEDPRSFDLSDAIAIPGLFAPSSIKEPKLKIEFTEIGGIEIGGNSVKSLVNEMFLSIFASHTHISATPTSPTGPALINGILPVPGWDSKCKTVNTKAD